MQEQSEAEKQHEARCEHIYNTFYALCQLYDDEDELGAVLSAASHAWCHFHGEYESKQLTVDVNQTEETEDSPAILTAVK